ncbi:hypothetical protein [Streptomyces collinus]|uniref:hypothetical protein n=1 Tax=Streptomyces collinus TaxID=42684 RepID=UPI0029425202|nr:hypothetical protein [Streptomyces collinus]
MGAEPDAGTFGEFLCFLGGSLENLAEMTQRAESSLDVVSLGAEELKQAFRVSLEDAGQDVIVAWPADGVAARVAYRDILERIDDLWYPSMDDLVLIDDCVGARRVLILDHEERLLTAPLVNSSFSSHPSSGG